MTRDEVNAFANAQAKIVQEFCPSGVRFSLLVLDEATGRATRVGTLSGDETQRLVEMLQNFGEVTVR